MRQAIARGSLRATIRNPRSVRAVATRTLRAAASEKKGVDTDLGIAGPIINTTNTNAQAFVLNLIQQGAGSWNRVGRKSILRSLRIKGWFTLSQGFTLPNGTTKENIVRMVVVWDKQPSGAIPNFGAIFGITDQTGTESSPNILVPPKYDNMDRFVVLKDVVIDNRAQGFFGGGAAPGTSQLVSVDCYIKLGLKETVFSGQTAPMSISDIASGALYVYFRAVNSDAESFAAFAGQARLRYSD